MKHENVRKIENSGEIRSFKKISVCTFLILLAVAVVQSQSNAPSYTEPRISFGQRGKLVGHVLDGARAKITLEGEGIRRELTADGNGDYEVELPPAQFRISVVTNSWSYPFKRSTFQLKPDEMTLINVVPARRILEVETQVVSNGLLDKVKTITSPRYETFYPLGREKNDLLVRYAERQEGRDFIQYGDAMISFDTLSVYAARVKLYKKSFGIEASGNEVFIEDGKKRTRVRRADINFKAGRVVVNLTPGAIEQVEGEGTLDVGRAAFNFKATRDSRAGLKLNADNQLTYSDPELDISLTSNWYNVMVTDDARNRITLEGFACVRGRNPLTEKSAPDACVAVSFIANIEAAAKGEKDRFSITIEGLSEYSRSGIVSSGSIRVIRNAD